MSIGASLDHQGHRFNVKLGVGRATRTAAPARTQVIVQGQLYVF